MFDSKSTQQSRWHRVYLVSGIIILAATTLAYSTAANAIDPAALLSANQMANSSPSVKEGVATAGTVSDVLQKQQRIIEAQSAELVRQAERITALEQRVQ